MRRKRIAILCLALAFGVVLSACTSAAPPSQNPFPVGVARDELLYESKEDFNSVEVYRQKGQLVINVKSEAEFFDGAQFLVETTGSPTPEDVTVQWTTLGGGTEKTENNDRILAEIFVRENGTVIFDRKINFLKKAFEAVEDVLKKRSK